MADKYLIAGYALVVALGVVLIRRLTSDRKKHGMSSILVKVYGLLSIGGFALLLATATNTESGVKTAGFTFLGTIAGFIAGKDAPDEDAEKDASEKEATPSPNGPPADTA
jgi:arginine exporter protein ArgO